MVTMSAVWDQLSAGRLSTEIEMNATAFPFICKFVAQN
jgi:hypothetical protein